MFCNQSLPALAQLQQYDAVLVYSDCTFSDPNQVGDVLADYMDSGGGVVTATFAFTSFSYGIFGRLQSAGYLPFTMGSYTSGIQLSLVGVQPQHPILNGVISFNGGTSSYHNTAIAVTSGSTLVANWSNGEPLIATKVPTLGRIVGLNFFPPSSDARSDFWVSSTNGALIMGNALIWAAR